MSSQLSAERARSKFISESSESKLNFDSSVGIENGGFNQIQFFFHLKMLQTTSGFILAKTIGGGVLGAF